MCEWRQLLHVRVHQSATQQLRFHVCGFIWHGLGHSTDTWVWRPSSLRPCLPGIWEDWFCATFFPFCCAFFRSYSPHNSPCVWQILQSWSANSRFDSELRKGSQSNSRTSPSRKPAEGYSKKINFTTISRKLTLGVLGDLENSRESVGR